MPAMAQGPTEHDWRVGVDTGGTFTDLLLADPTGRIRATCKVLSTPDDPGRAVLQGIERLLDQFNGPSSDEAGRARPLNIEGLDQVVHGSTVATNALLEAKGDKAALITTAGFEDLLVLARQDRPELYALSPHRPDPPIPSERVIGAHERIAYDGSVLTALTQHEVDRVIDLLRKSQVDAVAVCLLHSYANDAYEQLIAQAIREQLPEIHLTVSSELLPELREYERTSTCAVNAVVGPTMTRYLGALDEALGKGRLRIMASGGGTLAPSVVAQRPVETVMSGPAGGVLGAWAMAQSAGEANVIGFDMGGTSTDVALCEGGPTYTTETTINAMPIKLPVIDIHTVGAGGGSIAWIDAGGALRVGPQSAGADPGPACYGRQGENPCIATVTDAHVVLGYLRDGRQLGDSLAVDRSASIKAVSAIADQLGLAVEATAEGILRVADAAMARAIQRVSVHRGHDARGFMLVAFGGAGGLHACRLADVLGMTRVLIPVYGGLLSAYGMLAAPTRYAFSHAVLATLEPTGKAYPDPLKNELVQHAFDQLLQRGDLALQKEGVAPNDRRLHTAIDLRFAGQSYEITVSVADEVSVIETFLREHQRLYGYAPGGKPIEIVAARVEARGPRPGVLPGHATMNTQGLAGPEGFVSRQALEVGQTRMGPIVIEEYAATTVVPHGWTVQPLADGQVILEKHGDSRDA